MIPANQENPLDKARTDLMSKVQAFSGSANTLRDLIKTHRDNLATGQRAHGVKLKVMEVAVAELQQQVEELQTQVQLLIRI